MTTGLAPVFAIRLFSALMFVYFSRRYKLKTPSRKIDHH